MFLQTKDHVRATITSSISQEKESPEKANYILHGAFATNAPGTGFHKDPTFYEKMHPLIEQCNIRMAKCATTSMDADKLHFSHGDVCFSPKRKAFVSCEKD